MTGSKRAITNNHMAVTTIESSQIRASAVQRSDLNTGTVGQAVVAKIIQGTGVNLSSTGADAGTGDVTVSAPPSANTGNLLTTGTDSLLYLPPSALDPEITLVRMRSFNAIGNPNFEVDQRNYGASVALVPPFGSPTVDRFWPYYDGSPTMRFSAQQLAGNTALPGTNFLISQKFFRITLTTAQASLAAGDGFGIGTGIEGPSFRELINDVHSVSLLVRSSVANIKFGLALTDNTQGTATRSLTKLCTLGAANTFTLITLANLPVFPPAGNFPLTLGGFACNLLIALAAGTTYMSPANDVWQTGNYAGAVGQSNFAASAVNSTFDIAFIQHEPGPQCTTLIDKQFTQNLDEALRFYFKTYGFNVKAGASDFTGANGTFWAATATGAYGYAPFTKKMALVPNITIYNPSSGAANSVYNPATGAAIAVTGAGYVSNGGFGQITGTGFSGQQMVLHYTADTGW